jgi:hypothetical protein
MNALILATAERDQIAALNASGAPERQLYPAPLLDGRFALNADLLGDSGAGQTWEHYGGLLQTLATEVMGPEAFFIVNVS